MYLRHVPAEKWAKNVDPSVLLQPCAAVVCSALDIHLTGGSLR